MPLPPRPNDDPRPEPPEQPDDDACCHSGCDPCIFDLYDEALDRWRVELAAWEAREAARKAVKSAVRKAAAKGNGKSADVAPRKPAPTRKTTRKSPS